MAKKSIVTSVNLPVESLYTIIDIDDKNVEIPIEKAFKKYVNAKNDDGDNDLKIKTMNTISSMPSEYVNQKNIPLDVIKVENEIVNIINIKKRKIEKTNDISFYKVKLIFQNGLVKEFVVPSFVKFYSSRTGSFIPVEFLRSRHILLDYTGNIVKAEDSVPVDNFQMTDYYTIKIMYDMDEDNFKNENIVSYICNFYLNGVFVNVAYNNFQIKDNATTVEE